MPTQPATYADGRRRPGALQESATILADRYDVALLDLDGVVYLGAQAVAGATEALAAARQHGMRLTFVTNNASRTPEAVASHLTELGIAADRAEVVTSAQAAAHYLAERLPAGSRVLVLGTTGLVRALVERGLTPVRSADDDPDAVVQGYSPDLDWHQLAEGAIAINRGVRWVATNLDPTVPSARGRLPGNGSMVAALRHATGVDPVSTGKPDPAMHRETVERSGARRPLVVGDRLDTDVEGADRVGCDSLLVLTGVTDPADLLLAPPHRRPTYVSQDLSGLLRPHPGVDVLDSGARCGRWTATRAGDVVELAAAGEPVDVAVDPEAARAGAGDAAADDGMDALRALCGAAWNAGRPDAVVTCTSADEDGRRVLAQLSLA